MRQGVCDYDVGMFRIWIFYLACFLSLAGCQVSYPTRNPVGDTFPTVAGQTLAGEVITLPDALAGRPTVLLVAYSGRAKDDVLWWMTFAKMYLGDARVVSVPAVTSWWSWLWRDRLEDAIRNALPESYWPGVVTLYDDAPEVAGFTGNRHGSTARVLLLDEQGRVVFFNADGFNQHSSRWLKEAFAQRWGDQRSVRSP